MSAFSKFIHVYANPLSTFTAATVGSATVIWQTKTGNKDLKDDLKKETDALDKKIDLVKAELHSTKLDVEVIDTKLGMMNDNILSSVKAAGAAIKGNPNELDNLVARMEKCKESGGKDCQ